MRFDSPTRRLVWQVALLATFVVTGVAFVVAPPLLGNSSSSEPSTSAGATDPTTGASPGQSGGGPGTQTTGPSVTPQNPLKPGGSAFGSSPGGTSLAPGASSLAEEAQGFASATSFRVASFNALGDSHTRPGGNKHGWAPSSERTRNLVSILGSQGVDVVGLQEFEVAQRATFNQIATGWDVFTGTERGHDSIAYRTNVWQYVTGGTGTIPYFHGNPAPMPWVTLRHIATGREVSFISIHNPTSNPHRGNNAGSRAEATRREIAMVHTLAASGNPVMLLGDFNERDVAFCRVTAGGDIGAANGGSVGGSCTPPPSIGIDWIFGTTDIAFSEYLRHQDALVARTTDHPVIVARATITEPLP